MTYAEVIRLCIPDADDRLCEHILWGRTPFPMRTVWAKELYRAASAWKRAGAKGVVLCELCHRIAEPKRWTCRHCEDALERARNPLDI